MKIYILSEFRVHGFSESEVFADLVLDNLCELNKYQSTAIFGDKELAESILKKSNVLKYMYEIEVNQFKKNEY
jgi:hypothetical protein